MSLVSWFIKSKKDMSKKGTRNVRLGKYIVSSHVQNRVVEKERKLSKTDVPINLFTKPIRITKVRIDENGPSYQRIGKRSTTAINPSNNKVTTIWKASSKKKGKRK